MSNEWVENKGVMPVAGDVLVDICFGTGHKEYKYPASSWWWVQEQADPNFNIKFWRLHEEESVCEPEKVTKPNINPKQTLGLSSLPLNLFSPLATAYGCLGKLNGKLKYGENNFMGTEVIASIYADAIRRHLDKWMSGEEFDKADGVPHFSAMLANIDILISARAAGTLIDDRGMSKGYFEEIEKLTPIVKHLYDLHKDKRPHHYTLVEQREKEQNGPK